MLLIFDLDDTLINTFECITKPGYKELVRMLKHDYNYSYCKIVALQNLVKYRVETGSSVKAIELFFQDFNIDFDQKRALDFIYSFESEDVIHLNEGVESFLQQHKSIKKAIVTRGYEDRQRRKIQNSLLTSFDFANIIVVDTEDKSPAYKDLLQTYEVEKSVLIADRKEDFLYTENLITKRVLFVPKYFNETKLDFEVDLKISNLEELKSVL